MGPDKIISSAFYKYKMQHRHDDPTMSFPE